MTAAFAKISLKYKIYEHILQDTNFKEHDIFSCLCSTVSLKYQLCEHVSQTYAHIMKRVKLLALQC